MPAARARIPPILLLSQVVQSPSSVSLLTERVQLQRSNMRRNGHVLVRGASSWIPINAGTVSSSAVGCNQEVHRYCGQLYVIVREKERKLFSMSGFQMQLLRS
ncbi:unnamed protein product [Urochloa humidicola]